MLRRNERGYVTHACHALCGMPRNVLAGNGRRRHLLAVRGAWPTAYAYQVGGQSSTRGTTPLHAMQKRHTYIHSLRQRRILTLPPPIAPC